MSDDDTSDVVEHEIGKRLAAWYGGPLTVDRAHRDRVIIDAIQWRVPRTPALAWFAAACAAVLVLGALIGRSRLHALDHGAIRRLAAAPVSVRFVLRAAPTAARVSVVGDFNGWNASATPLDRESSGPVWTVDVRVPPGRYGYAFIVDGHEWIVDPTAPLASDAFGNLTSVLVVGGAT